MARPKGQGKTPGSGRKKGTCNGDTAKLRQMILNALDDAGGQGYLKRQAEENPAQFLTLIGKVLPKDVNVGGQPGNPLINRVEIEIVSTTDSSTGQA